MKKIKTYIINITVALATGFISYFLTKNGIAEYNAYYAKPFLSPPDIVFMIVWPLLYILMAFGYSKVKLSENNNSHSAKYYWLQLLFNFLWSIIFFNFKLFFAAFIWLILLLYLVLSMTNEFYKVSKFSAAIQIPYILWLIYAAFLNFTVYWIN